MNKLPYQNIFIFNQSVCLSMCICACVYACICMHVCTSAFVEGLCVKDRSTSSVVPWLTLPFVFLDRISFKACCFLLTRPWALLVSTLKVHTPTPSFLYIDWSLNSGLHACIVNTILMEPSLQCQKKLLKQLCKSPLLQTNKDYMGKLKIWKSRWLE